MRPNARARSNRDRRLPTDRKDCASKLDKPAEEGGRPPAIDLVRDRPRLQTSSPEPQKHAHHLSGFTGGHYSYRRRRDGASRPRRVCSRRKCPLCMARQKSSNACGTQLRWRNRLARWQCPMHFLGPRPLRLGQPPPTSRLRHCGVEGLVWRGASTAGRREGR